MQVVFVVLSKLQKSSTQIKRKQKLKTKSQFRLVKYVLANRPLSIFTEMFFLLVFIPVISLAGSVITSGPLSEEQEMKQPNQPRLNQKRDGAPWILNWYGPDGGYMNNGGAKKSAFIDHIKNATNGVLDQPSLSTIEGLLKTKHVKINFEPKHSMTGTEGEWMITNLGTRADAAGGRNMSSRYGFRDLNNFDTWQIIVINAPKDMKAIMSPAQDDYAQIWINGQKWHNDSEWTGGPTEVDFDVQVELKVGNNVLLYRCGESGGHEYANLYFDRTTMQQVRIIPNQAKTKAAFFDELANLPTLVYRRDKLACFWADFKLIVRQ